MLNGNFVGSPVTGTRLLSLRDAASGIDIVPAGAELPAYVALCAIIGSGGGMRIVIGIGGGIAGIGSGIAGIGGTGPQSPPLGIGPHAPLNGMLRARGAFVDTGTGTTLTLALSFEWCSITPISRLCSPSSIL